MIFVRLVAALAVAVGLHAAGAWLWPWFPVIVDLFLLLAVYFSLGRSPASSALGGTLAGLAYDAISGGFYGLHGFANTLVAWAAASVQHRILIHQPIQIFTLFALASGVQLLTLACLHILLLPQRGLPGPDVMVGRMLVAGALGTVLFLAHRRLGVAEQAWREKRGRRLRIDTR